MLAKARFKFHASELSETEVSSDSDPLGASMRVAVKLAPTLLHAFGVEVPPGATDLSGSFDVPALQRRLDTIREFARTVCFKYVLSQPIVVAAVRADGLGGAEAVAVARRFSDVMLDMRELTGQLGGFQFGNKRHFGTRLSVTGVLLFVYFDPASASTFIEQTMKQCKFYHFWAKTRIEPWVADVTEKTVRSHSALTVTGSFLSRRRLQDDLFR